MYNCMSCFWLSLATGLSLDVSKRHFLLLLMIVLVGQAVQQYKIITPSPPPPPPDFLFHIRFKQPETRIARTQTTPEWTRARGAFWVTVVVAWLAFLLVLAASLGRSWFDEQDTFRASDPRILATCRNDGTLSVEQRKVCDECEFRYCFLLAY